MPITVALINTTWYAAIQANASTANLGYQNVTPILHVRKTGDPAFSAASPGITTGITENVYGLYSNAAINQSITVKNRALANPDLTLSFSVTPRFALAPTISPPFAGDTIKLYPQVTPGDGRTLSNLTYTWTLTNAVTGNPQSFTGSNTAFPLINTAAAPLNLPQGAYNVTLAVGYKATFTNSSGTTQDSSTTSLSITKKSMSGTAKQESPASPPISTPPSASSASPSNPAGTSSP